MERRSATKLSMHPEKRERLRALLLAAGSMLIAYSGGVDSAYLAWEARQSLGRDNVLALIADSASLPRRHLREALSFARAHDIACESIATRELEDPRYRQNQPDRCFFCKDELFRRMEQELAARPNFRLLSYGLNADDPADFRPGHAAARQHGVRAPLAEAGLRKQEIRDLARHAGLQIWDRPAAACLSSRVAYGLEVTPAVLERIELGEEALAELGFRQFRVRYHGQIVRIEIAPEELRRALNPRMAGQLVAIFKRLGFAFITLDLEGYRTGSLNAGLVAIASGSSASTVR